MKLMQSSIAFALGLGIAAPALAESVWLTTAQGMHVSLPKDAVCVKTESPRGHNTAIGRVVTRRFYDDGDVRVTYGGQHLVNSGACPNVNVIVIHGGGSGDGGGNPNFKKDELPTTDTPLTAH